MKKISLLFVVLFTILFGPFGCSCFNEETVSKEEASEVLINSKINGNVKITTTTETTVDSKKSTSIQTDYYYNDKYYHVSDSKDISTKTWYGYVDDILYAFYYTKNATNNEIKSSSRIDKSQLESIQNQTNSIIDNLLDSNGNLIENHEINATKKGNEYTIQINQNSENESNIYTIIVSNGKLIKIEKYSGIESDSIKTIYTYDYDIEEFELPSLTEYPLNVNN